MHKGIFAFTTNITVACLVACGGGDQDGGAAPTLAQSSQAQRMDNLVMVKALGASVVDATTSPLVDHAVNLQDAIAILKLIVGLEVNGGGQTVTTYQLFAADFDGNGKIELADAIGVLKRVVGLDSPSPKWLVFNTYGSASFVSDKLNPGQPPELSTDIFGSTPAQVGLVAVLRGDVVGGALTYSWSLGDKPNGSSAVLADATGSAPNFAADLPGDYVATLTVTDGSTSRTSTSVTLTATAKAPLPKNIAPIANAGAIQNVPFGSLITLDGTGEDANSDSLTYEWTLQTPPGSKAILSSATTPKPTLTGDISGIYIATLIVSDGRLRSTASQVTITVATNPNTLLLQTPVVGDYRVYSSLYTPTLPAGQNPIATTFVRSFPTVNSDGSRVRAYTSSYLSYISDSISYDSSDNQVSYSSATRQCTYSPVYKPNPKAGSVIGDTWSDTATLYCQPLPSGSPATNIYSGVGLILGAEKIKVNAGSFDTIKYSWSYTDTVPLSYTSQIVQIGWAEKQTGMLVKSITLSTVTRSGQVDATIKSTADYELVAYVSQGQAPVGPAVQRFVGYWNFNFNDGIKIIKCTRTLFDINGVFAGIVCDDLVAHTFSGSVSPSGNLTGILDGLISLQGSLTSPTAGRGTISSGPNSGNWSAIHN